MVERTCANCGRDLPPRAHRYCKDEACVKERKAAYMREFYRRGGSGACSEPDCEKPVRAKELCSTHYNQAHLTKEQRHPRALVACSVCGTPTERAASVRQRYQPTCSVHCRTILEHGAPARTTYDWAADSARRAGQAGAAVIERIDRLDVFARDDWTCYQCGVRVSLGDCYARDSATVDHVVPLSRGGQHTMANVKTCCLSCNSAKQDRLPVSA